MEAWLSSPEAVSILTELIWPDDDDDDVIVYLIKCHAMKTYISVHS